MFSTGCMSKVWGVYISYICIVYTGAPGFPFFIVVRIITVHSRAGNTCKTPKLSVSCTPRKLPECLLDWPARFQKHWSSAFVCWPADCDSRVTGSLKPFTNVYIFNRKQIFSRSTSKVLTQKLRAFHIGAYTLIVSAEIGFCSWFCKQYRSQSRLRKL